MKHILSLCRYLALAAFIAICGGALNLANAAAYDIVFMQRTSTDSASIQRIPAHPTLTPGVLLYDPSTNLPVWALLGTGLVYDGTSINASGSGGCTTWACITDKPTFATVATSGAYADLSGTPALAAVATSGAYADLSGRPSLAAVALSGSYADLTGKPTIPAAQVNTDWSSNSGVSQLLNKPTTLAGYGITDAVSASTLSSTLANYVTSSSLTGTLSGYVTASGLTTTLASYVTSSTLTTTLSGYATTSALTSGLAGKFNTPTGTTSQYIRGDGSLATFPALTSGTVTSVNLSSTTLTASGGPITTSGTLTVNLPSVITAGTYSSLTVDVYGRAVAGTTRTYNNGVARSLNSNYTISSTRDARVTYSINAQWALATLLSGSAAVYLEYSTNAGSTWVLVSQVGKQFGLLTIAGQDDMNITGEVPANALVRLRMTSSNMTVTYTTGQEVLQ